MLAQFPSIGHSNVHSLPSPRQVIHRIKTLRYQQTGVLLQAHIRHGRVWYEKACGGYSHVSIVCFAHALRAGALGTSYLD